MGTRTCRKLLILLHVHAAIRLDFVSSGHSLTIRFTLAWYSREVGIATSNGLDGPGIECRWGRDFPHLSRPAIGAAQTPLARG